jgi:hypothetical protein
MRLREGAARRLVVSTATLAVLVGAGAARGGYFPGSWGWLALACAWVAGIALALDDDASVGRAGAGLVLVATGLGAWTLASVLWSSDVTQTVLEAQRMLVYIAALLALVVAGRGAGDALITGAWGAASLLAGYGLLTRLLPERLGVSDAISGYRLSEPVGYWNALGLLAAMGLLLGAGLAARARSLVLRALGAASLVPLALALYFTFSRGAWIALAGGALVVVMVDRARLQMLATLAAAGIWPAVAVLLAAREHALVTVGSPLAARSHEGHRMLLATCALAVAGGAAALVLAWLGRRLAVPPRMRSVAAALLLALALAAAVAGSAAYGAPWTLAARGWHTFSSSSPATTSNLNSRLFHLSGTGRVAQWHVAWRNVRAHPLLGSGAGTFELAWLRDRPTPSKVRDTHNLYLETLTELGPVGLALLIALLVIPLAAIVRARRRALGAAAAGAYVAYLLHAAVDWDWEVGAVTLVALTCAAALTSSAEGRSLRPRRRLLLAFAVVLAAAAVYTVGERIELGRESSAAARGDWPAAAHAARRASSLAPWSSEPWQTLGEAELAAGRLEPARADIRRALDHDRRNWQLWLDLARASDGRARVAAMNRVADLDPLSPELAAYVASLQSLSRIQTGHP